MLRRAGLERFRLPEPRDVLDDPFAGVGGEIVKFDVETNKIVQRKKLRREIRLVKPKGIRRGPGMACTQGIDDTLVKFDDLHPIAEAEHDHVDHWLQRLDHREHDQPRR